MQIRFNPSGASISRSAKREALEAPAPPAATELGSAEVTTTVHVRRCQQPQMEIGGRGHDVEMWADEARE